MIQLANYKKSYEEDDLVSMRREFRFDYEEKKEYWKQYVEEIKSFLAREQSENGILPAEQKKEPLDAKIERLTTNDPPSQPSSNKQKNTKKEAAREEQLSLF